MDVAVTELIELEASAVSGVTRPANGTEWILIKSASDDDDSTDEMDMDGDGDSDAEDSAAVRAFESNSGKKLSPKAKAAFARNTKRIKAKAKKAAGMSDDKHPDDCDCSECCDIEDMLTKALSKAVLDSAARNALPDSAFAYIDSSGERHLPVHDAEHARAAISRFGQTKFESDDAKSKAAKKVKAAADKFGVDTDFGKAAKAEANNGGTVTPEAAGHLRTGTTLPWFTETVTATPMQASQNGAGLPGVPGSSSLQGGETPYKAKSEARINGPAVLNPGAYVKAKAATQVMEAVERELVEAVEKASYVTMDKFLDSPDPTMNYQQIAQALADASQSIDAMVAKHQVNNALGGGDPDSDMYDLQTISSSLDNALALVAKLSFQMDAACKSEEKDAAEGFAVDAADAAVIKAYRRLRASDEKALRDAHSALTNVLTQHDTTAAAQADDKEPDESEAIHMDVTKEELGELVAKAAREAVDAAMKQSANNMGDPMNEEPTATMDADDLSIPGSSNPESGVTKEAFEAQAAELAELRKQVQTLSSQPKPGGPAMNAQGALAAREGRQGTVTKSEVDTEIERLEKSLAEATDPQQKDYLGQELTRQKLTRLHMTGQL